MPLVACSSCRTRFKVKINAVNTVLKCPRCGESFQAVALRAEPRRRYGMPPIAYAGIIVAAMLVALFITMSGRRRTPQVDATETAPASSAQTSPRTEAPALSTRDFVEKRARDVLKALQTGDDESLAMLYVDFPAMQRARVSAGQESASWTSLSDIERFAKKDAYIKELYGNPNEDTLTRRAVVKALDVKMEGVANATVVAQLKDPVNGATQPVTMSFEAAGSNWRLVALQRGELAGLDAPEEHAPVDLTTIGRIKRSPEGEVKPVEPVAGTPPTVESEIKRQIDVLLDKDATTAAAKARQVLVGIGKPGIPHLLNALAGLNLDAPDDVASATKITLTLMELSGMDWAIVPGGNVGSMTGEDSQDNESKRRLWFGWWRDVKDSYSGPPAPEGFDPNAAGSKGGSKPTKKGGR